MTLTPIHFYLKKFSSKESRLNPFNSWRAGNRPGARIFQNLSPARIPAFVVSMGFLIPAGTHKNFEILGIEKISEFGNRPLLAIPILRRLKKIKRLLDFY